MIVVIDGPAGSGKSTVARTLSAREGLTYLDTGAMYRSVAWLALSRGCDPADEKAVSGLVGDCEISFVHEGEVDHVVVNGTDVTEAIRTPEIDRTVSVVAAMPAVRSAMTERQRAIARGCDIVAEGRDMGTVVLPQADVKVFLTADASARAHRRTVQREGGDAAKDATTKTDAAEESSVLADIERRDHLDSTRAVAPLRPAADATHIDSTDLTVDQVCDRIHDLIRQTRSRTDAAAAPASAPGPADAPAPRGARSSDASAQRPMRAFHNEREDYFDHGMREFPWPSRAIFSFAAAVVYAVTKIWHRWVVEDKDAFVAYAREHGCVVVMNHVSMVEPVAFVAMMWVNGLRVRPIYKREFDSNALTRWVFSRVGGIPVDRGTADLKSVRRAQRAMQRGECVLIYPEGTRIKSDDQPVTVHGGFSLMAQLAKADVVPAAVVGARDVTPQGHHVARPLKVYLKVGAPISFASLGVSKRKEQLQAMEDEAMRQVYLLRDELRREHPGKE